MSSLRSRVIKLAYQNISLRADLLPLLKEGMVPPPPPLSNFDFRRPGGLPPLPQIVPPQEKLDVRVGDWVTTNDFRLRGNPLVVSMVNEDRVIRGKIKTIGVRSVDLETGKMGQVFLGAPSRFKKTRPPRMDRNVEGVIRRDLTNMNLRKKLILVGATQQEDS